LEISIVLDEKEAKFFLRILFEEWLQKLPFIKERKLDGVIIDFRK